MEKESGAVVKTIEVYLEGKWFPWDVEISKEIDSRLESGRTIKIADDDNEEIFIRNVPIQQNRTD